VVAHPAKELGVVDPSVRHDLACRPAVRGLARDAKHLQQRVAASER
jgi:hypothetical protein